MLNKFQQENTFLDLTKITGTLKYDFCFLNFYSFYSHWGELQH